MSLFNTKIFSEEDSSVNEEYMYWEIGKVMEMGMKLEKWSWECENMNKIQIFHIKMKKVGNH
jgi:hypothetical protein